MAAGRTLYLRVGILAVVGVVLAVAFVIYLASSRGLRNAKIFETYVSESVQGLDVGAPVRYRGVAIGRVTEIGLVGATYRRPEGTDFNQLFQLVLVRFAVDMSQLGDVPAVEDAIRQGLRVQIASTGITGVRYVELNFISAQRFAALQPPWQPRYTYLPSVPSTVTQVQNAAERFVERMQALPVEQIAADLAGLISNMRGQTGDGDLARLLREAAGVTAALRGTVETADIAGMVAELRATVGDAREILTGREARSAIANASAAALDLRRAAQRLPAAIEGLERSMRTVRQTTADVQAELAPLLSDLRATSANLRATTEVLRQAPSQLLFGAPPEPRR